MYWAWTCQVHMPSAELMTACIFFLSIRVLRGSLPSALETNVSNKIGSHFLARRAFLLDRSSDNRVRIAPLQPSAPVDSSECTSVLIYSALEFLLLLFLEKCLLKILLPRAVEELPTVPRFTARFFGLCAWLQGLSAEGALWFELWSGLVIILSGLGECHRAQRQRSAIRDGRAPNDIHILDSPSSLLGSGLFPALVQMFLHEGLSMYAGCSPPPATDDIFRVGMMMTMDASNRAWHGARHVHGVVSNSTPPTRLICTSFHHGVARI